MTSGPVASFAASSVAGCTVVATHTNTKSKMVETKGCFRQFYGNYTVPSFCRPQDKVEKLYSFIKHFFFKFKYKLRYLNS